ncbi:MAG: hypothetical protein QM626_04050 [Microbacterium sp.]|uniref:hypothetical protein n=1 Tax=Microbacterium sp. TaxID=51671 RepID=UPI0039E709ED
MGVIGTVAMSAGIAVMSLWWPSVPVADGAVAASVVSAVTTCPAVADGITSPEVTTSFACPVVDDAVAPLAVVAAFACATGASEIAAACAQAAGFGEPRPVYSISQAYVDGASENPLGTLDGWIAVAYDSEGAIIGTTVAEEQGDQWRLAGLDPRKDVAAGVAEHARDVFLQINMTGGAFYGFDGLNLLGLNEPARQIAAQPRSAIDARADVIAAFDRSDTSSVAAENGSPVLVIVMAMLGIGVIIAFARLASDREGRVRTRAAATTRSFPQPIRCSPD